MCGIRQNRRGSESSTLETDVYVWRCALLVAHATQEEEHSAKVWDVFVQYFFQNHSYSQHPFPHSLLIFWLLGWTLMLHDDIDRRWRQSRRSWRRRCRASGARSRSWARLWRRSIDGTTSSMTAHENHFSTDSRRSLTSNCSETLRCSPVNSWCVVWWNILRAINLGTTCVENLFSQPVEKWLNYLCSLSFRIGYNAKLISSKLNRTIYIGVSNRQCACIETAVSSFIQLVNYCSNTPFLPVWMPDETGAKKILTASPGELEETTKTASYHVDKDYPARPEI